LYFRLAARFTDWFGLVVIVRRFGVLGECWCFVVALDVEWVCCSWGGLPATFGGAYVFVWLFLGFDFWLVF
jgi:hypothetical protein